VDGAAGDVRNAVNSLHMLLLEPRPVSGRAGGTPSGVSIATALPAALLDRYGSLLEDGLLADDAPDTDATASRCVRSAVVGLGARGSPDSDELESFGRCGHPFTGQL